MSVASIDWKKKVIGTHHFFFTTLGWHVARQLVYNFASGFWHAYSLTPLGTKLIARNTQFQHSPTLVATTWRECWHRQVWLARIHRRWFDGLFSPSMGSYADVSGAGSQNKHYITEKICDINDVGFVPYFECAHFLFTASACVCEEAGLIHP